MDDDQSGRGDLTAERRRELTAKLWALPANSPDWRCVVSCGNAVRSANPGRWGNLKVVTTFTYPHRHPDFLDAILAEYLGRKLLGETT